MLKSEYIQLQEYFVRSSKIWFPDFVETIEEEHDRYSRYSSDFSGLRALLSFFRGELTRVQFADCFLKYDAPHKMLSKQRRLYYRTQELCVAYQNRSISDVEFDEQLLLAFRNRPTEDVFSPAFESWGEITALISLLEKKSKQLPVHFDGLAWGTYLKGIVTSRQYAAAYLAFDTGSHLTQVMSYGADKERLRKNYSMEISVCLRLNKLCFDYDNKLLSPDDFKLQFLQLAKEFCSDIKEKKQKRRETTQYSPIHSILKQMNRGDIHGFTARSNYRWSNFSNGLRTPRRIRICTADTFKYL